MLEFLKRPVCLLGAGLLCVSLAGAGCASSRAEEKDAKEEHEVKMPLDQAPAAVKTTLTREAEGATIKDVDKEEEKGKVCYEADAVINGKNYEIKVAEDGTLISKKLDNEEDEKGDKDKK